MNPVNNRIAVLLLILSIAYIAIHFVFSFSNVFSYNFLAFAIMSAVMSFAYVVEACKEYNRNAKELKEAKRILKSTPVSEDLYFKNFYNN